MNGWGKQEWEGALVLLERRPWTDGQVDRRTDAWGFQTRGRQAGAGTAWRPGTCPGVGRDAGPVGPWWGTGASGGGGQWLGEGPASEMAAQVTRSQARAQEPEALPVTSPPAHLPGPRWHRLSLPPTGLEGPAQGTGAQGLGFRPLSTLHMNNAAAEIGR